MMAQRITNYTKAQPVAPTQEDGWIAPDGKFYAIPCGDHYEFAEQFAHTKPSSLEAQGWLHISYGFIRNFNVQITQPQMDTLWDAFQADPRSARALELKYWLDGGK
jgi:hypothetical protein